jgi:hypothetical protein
MRTNITAPTQSLPLPTFAQSEGANSANVEAKNQADAWKELDKSIEGKILVELHTHLLGMGSADFWVSRIMVTYLPRVSRPVE